MLLKPFSPDDSLLDIITTASNPPKNGVAEDLNSRRSVRRSKLESEPEQATDESTTPILTSAPSTPCPGEPMLVLHAA